MRTGWKPICSKPPVGISLEDVTLLEPTYGRDTKLGVSSCLSLRVSESKLLKGNSRKASRSSSSNLQALDVSLFSGGKPRNLNEHQRFRVPANKPSMLTKCQASCTLWGGEGE